MSDFVESEADVSSGSDSEEEVGTTKKRPAISSDEEEDDEEKGGEEMKNFIDDSSAEEDEEGEDLKDLIDDRPVAEEPEEDSGDEGEKRKHEDSDQMEEDLSDDDYALIEENLGIKVQRKPHKRKRIRMMSDDEDSGKDGDGEGDEREVIEHELFDGEDGEEGPPQSPEGSKVQEEAPEDYGNLEGSEESDVDDFIVDEDNVPISKGKKKKHIIHDDRALQEAQDIFGVDFDFDEFEQYGGEDYDEEEELEEEYEEEEEVGEDGEVRTRPKKTNKRRAAKTTIFDVFEPSELERGHFTDLDQEIRSSDMPERFQLRGIPVCPTEEGELDEESEWIFVKAFKTAPLSTQDLHDPGERQGQYGSTYSSRRGPETVEKIRKALNFMRNQQFEVPFIAFYRKEDVEPELAINDLWKVYHWDEKWMQLRNRKQNLVRLFEKMQQYQFDQVDLDNLEASFRTLTEEDLDRAKSVQSLDELRDVYQHFLLYYGTEIPKMKNALAAKRKQKKVNVEGGEGGEEENQEPEEEEEQHDMLKQATRKTGYTMCQQAGLDDMARKFGLTPEQFGENLRDNYQRHEVEQDPAEPQEIAAEYIKGQFKTADDVLKGARHMVAMQIAHDPLVRKTVRTTFYERARISIRPTKKGLKEIDEAHPCYPFKYAKDKPIKDLQNDQFVKLHIAVEDGMMEYTIHIDNFVLGPDKNYTGIHGYLDEIRQLYYRDEFSMLVQDWNNQRGEVLERAIRLILYPHIVKELKAKLLDEAREHVIRASCLKLSNWLKVAPYQADQQLDDDDDDFDTSKGIRVMGIAYVYDRDQATYGALIDHDGEVTDYLRLSHIKKRSKSWNKEERDEKESDMTKLKNFIASKKPHVIAVASQCRMSVTLMQDIQAVVAELEQEEQMAPIGVELVDNELAIIYQNSSKSQTDFREYPPLLKQAVSIARRLQDPLMEFCQLCNVDEDILCLKFHPLQDAISKEELLNALNLEFVNRVNEVGVDVNQCVAHGHTASLVQFVCGLGPRKGSHLLRILKQNNSRLENRTQLVMMCHMGPKVFINCAGFIKIDTNSLGDSTEAYVEVLDGSRVHPETYEWARKMAVDALEYDDTAEDANPAGALEEILESPERLKDLDLDAFAEELERQDYGKKHITLYDIRAELNHRYKDLRTPYRAPTAEEKFNMLTKETPATFYIGKMVMCTVTGFAHRRPQGEQLDSANPVRSDETGLWKCPFCMKSDFPELSEVWNHFDAGECPGQAVGVRTRVDNGVNGFIHLKNLSDKPVINPEERVRPQMTVHCRIMKIDIERFQVDLTCKSSDLSDEDNQWKVQKDPYYDFETEKTERKKDDEKKKQQARQTYVKRVIAHPSFHNVDYKTAEKLLVNMEQGDVVVRPSSKGSDHLTVTWKVTDGVHQHIDVREENKENAFSLGKSLWILNEEFEDLDEIIARHIQPMAAFCRDLLNYKYYYDSEGGKREIIDKLLMEEKKKAPSRIPYYFSATKAYPGKFMMSYLPRKSTKHEYMTVTPEGIRYRSHTYHSIGSLVRWFKEHFRDPIPGTPSAMRTPGAMRTPSAMRTPLGMPGSLHGTPSMNLSGVDAATIHRAAAGLSSNVYNTLAQVAGNTPGQFNQNAYQPGFTPSFAYQPQIATPMMTPMLTPSQYHTNQAMATPVSHMATPAAHHMGTPAHHISTPAQPLTTPQYTPTPRATWNPPTATPNQRTPSQRPPRPAVPAMSSVTDWAKAAEMWAKQKQQEQKQTKKPGTPRPGQSPAVGGDATPLIDER